MVEKGSNHEGIKWDPIKDCTPGQPENQKVKPKDISDSSKDPSDTTSTELVKKPGPAGTKPKLNISGIENGA